MLKRERENGREKEREREHKNAQYCVMEPFNI